ncbi:DUF4178 domain-containing protein [Sphaerisporangium perillae]|uniref:DUF4178 domain-containing protein n=1 Tax=Sphaerisporangium perillae TaxID=2935860 RepID=UPI00200E45DD|nr:DUF4178 domain-containing protein [Sphaerisporangium perillae]
MTVAVVLAVSAAIFVVVLGAYLGTRRQDRTARPAPRPPEPPEPMSSHPALARPVILDPDYLDPRTIKVGDVIDRQGMRSRVLGALHLSWQGDQWIEYLLEEGMGHYYQWLSVEERQGPDPEDPPHLEVYLWTPVPTQGMVPAKSMLIMEGVEFHPTQRGTASFRSEGTTGYPERGLVDFADYRAADGRLLGFNRVQGQAWTAAYAQPLSPGSIKVERML